MNVVDVEVISTVCSAIPSPIFMIRYVNCVGPTYRYSERSSLLVIGAIARNNKQSQNRQAAGGTDADPRWLVIGLGANIGYSIAKAVSSCCIELKRLLNKTPELPATS